MFERFTDRARGVIVLSQEEARELKHNYIGTEHIFLGLLREGQGIGGQALARHDITLEKTVSALTEIVGIGDSVFDGPVPFTPRAKKVLEFALREALQLGHNYIGTEHLLLGILRDPDGLVSQLLAQWNVNSEDIRSTVLELMNTHGDSNEVEDVEGSLDAPEPTAGAGSRPPRPGGRREERSILEQFATNLTEKARKGEIDPVIGRSKEIERVVRTLARRTKNNPVLVGQPGVGKSAIVEGLAQRIIDGQVPSILRDKEIFTLDLPGMVAGTRYRGDFEERLKNSIKEIKKRGNVIVFIDELHTLVGAGGSEGAMDAANILKPMLARGEMQTIGATTLNEYRKYIEKDAALERRFQPITVDAPSVEDTIAILTGLSDRYEAHHGVKITPEAINAAVTMSDRYITDRFLPDKAIDLMDEAAARLNLEQSIGLLSSVEDIEEVAALREKKNAAIAEGEYDKAQEFRVEEKKLIEAALDAPQAEGVEAPVLTAAMIAEVLADATGVPVGQISMEETARLLNLEGELHKRVVGQENAITALSKAVRRARSGLKDPKRPGGSFIFAGPSGVGKAQPLTSKILTPSGWSTMGEMEVGTIVSTPDGKNAVVDGVFPQGVRDVYQVTFADGRTVEASDEHIWRVWSHSHLGRTNTKSKPSGEWKNITTLEMKERLELKSVRNIAVQLTEPVVYNEGNTLPMDSYVLGALLGDGSFGDDIRLTTADSFMVEKINEKISQYGVSLSQHKGQSISYTIKSIEPLTGIRAVKGVKDSGVILNPIGKKLHELELLGKRSWEKSIPEAYKTASVEERFALIQGLMDTDGTVTKTGSLSFATTSLLLAEDVQEMIRSLGGNARIKEKQTHYTHLGIKKAGRLSYNVIITHKEPKRLVSLPRKLERISDTYQYAETLKNTIKSVEFVRRDEVQCIHLNNEDHLYITDGFTVTHNTELAKTLAEFLFGSDDALITLDMSEYSEKHTVARLFGSPPGYVGHEEGGQLTEKVRRRPFSVILFDEIEKAHPDIFNTLLQVLDEGRLSDGQGRVIDFKNTVIIMTTNLGSRDISRGVPVGFATSDNDVADYNRMKAKVDAELKQNFRPEFINRLDDIIVFHPLTRDNIIEIVDMMVDTLAGRLEARNLGLRLTPAAKMFLADKGYDPIYGARPLRRTIQTEIEDSLSEKILFGEYASGETIVIDAVGEGEDATLIFAAEIPKQDDSKTVEEASN